MPGVLGELTQHLQLQRPWRARPRPSTTVSELTADIVRRDDSPRRRWADCTDAIVSSLASVKDGQGWRECRSTIDMPIGGGRDGLIGSGIPLPGSSAADISGASGACRAPAGRRLSRSVIDLVQVVGRFESCSSLSYAGETERMGDADSGRHGWCIGDPWDGAHDPGIGIASGRLDRSAEPGRSDSFERRGGDLDRRDRTGKGGDRVTGRADDRWPARRGRAARRRCRGRRARDRT